VLPDETNSQTPSPFETAPSEKYVVKSMPMRRGSSDTSYPWAVELMNNS